MSIIFHRIVRLIHDGEVLVTRHGYRELAKDWISIDDILATIDDAIVVEEYPEYYKGPCVLVLQQDGEGRPIHVLWGIPKGADKPAVLITAYRPDPAKWDIEFRRRKK